MEATGREDGSPRPHTPHGTAGQVGKAATASSSSSSFSFGQAAFILIRVKRAFKRRRAKLKSFPDSETPQRRAHRGLRLTPERSDGSQETELRSGKPINNSKANSVKEGGGVTSSRPPLVRSRTLPAIVVPGVTILQAQIDTARTQSAVKRDCSPPRSRSGSSYCDEGGGGGGGGGGGSSPCGSPGGLKVPGSSPQGGLGRIARLLTKDSRHDGDTYRRRTHSLERRSLRLHLHNTADFQHPSKTGCTTLRRASSIDSLVEAGNNNTISANNNNKDGGSGGSGSGGGSKTNGLVKSYMPVSPLTPKRASAKQDKGDRSLPGWPTMDILVDGLNLSKADRKKLEKINKINIHLHALFAAVEHGQLEKARNIIENNSLDINCVNGDGLNVLEVAVMNNHVSLAKMLQQAGATHTHTGNVEGRLKHLNELVRKAEQRREELTTLLSTGTHVKENDRQKALWDRRVKILRKMKLGLEQLKPPGPPSSAKVEVVDSTRVRVTFSEPEVQHLAITTRFKVEWSTDEWATVASSLEVTDLHNMCVLLDGLTQGVRHHFRVAAGNIKDYGTPIPTSPPAAVPSSWRDTDGRKPRFDGQLSKLDNLFNQVRNSRPEHAAEIRAIDLGQETPLSHRRAQKKKSIKQLFTPAPKFHKNLKRGSYLACIMYCEDKVLVTNEEFPPVVEVDENYLSSAKTHFHWLLKVATTWEDVKSLRQDMERAGSASNVPFRIKLLQAAANMQSALGLQDLGQFYHQPIKDSSGTLVFCTVRHVKQAKSISTMNAKWVPLDKIKDKKIIGTSGPISSPGESGTSGATDLLLASLQDQINYDRKSRIPLERGLYLGYLKLQSSIDLMQVLVKEDQPNMFPHVLVRDNPHVSREEWEWVQQLSKYSSRSRESWEMSEDSEGSDCEQDTTQFPSPTPAQALWDSQLSESIRSLLTELNLEEEEVRLQHRLYPVEVIQLSSDVSLLLLMPPSESVCSAPCQEDSLLARPDLTAIPLQIFEMVHMGTYQRELISRYARLSYILEMDTLMAQHASREAFSQVEVTDAKERLWQLQQFQTQLDTTWRGLRWVLDAITYARDKATPGVSLATILSRPCPEEGMGSSQLGSTREACTSSSESLQHVLDNKRLRKDDNLSFHVKKTDGARMLKSNTSENIRSPNKADSKFHKSKTSECLLPAGKCQSCTKSHSSLTDAIGDCDEQSENVPLLGWAGDKIKCSAERKCYNKGLTSSRSENHLQQCSEKTYAPPRKASAPSFFETGDMGLTSQCCKSEPKISQVSSSSLESVESTKRKKTPEATYDKSSTAGSKSPTGSCYDLNQRYNSNLSVEIQRTGSSLSHDSEASYSSMTASLRSLSSNETETDTLSLISKDSGPSESGEGGKVVTEDEAGIGGKKSEEPAIIQVFAAYETGLASGTSVKLHVTPRTTAREVIDLVVKQLNMAVVLKGKDGPIYGNDKLKSFCLVAVIGARERCLRDDFRPLQLQNPWKKGRLYVRMKHDLLAAIEQSNSRHSAYL